MSHWPRGAVGRGPGREPKCPMMQAFIGRGREAVPCACAVRPCRRSRLRNTRGSRSRLCFPDTWHGTRAHGTRCRLARGRARPRAGWIILKLMDGCKSKCHEPRGARLQREPPRIRRAAAQARVSAWASPCSCTARTYAHAATREARRRIPQPAPRFLDARRPQAAGTTT